MVSKNNLYLKQTKTADQIPHYGLRKLSVGVASVLLSTTLYLGVTAQADTLPTGDESQSPATSAIADSSSSSAGTLTIAQSAGSTADTQETTDSTVSQANSTATSQSSESAVSASPVSESAADDQNTPASSAASNAGQTVEPAVSASPVSAFPVSESAADDQNTPTSSAASNADQTAEPAVNTFSVSDLAATMFDLSPSAAESAVNSELAANTASDAQTQTIADNDPMNHTSFQVTVHYKKDGATNTFMPDTVITTKYKRTTTKDLVTGKYTATPFVLESISQTGTKINGLGTPTEGVIKDVPAGWQYFTYSIPYNVSVPGWHPTYSGSSFTDAIGIAAGTSTAMKTAELTAIYAANTQTTHIKYVDANGTVVKTDTISGKTDTTQPVNSTVPTGWKMTTPQTIPTSVTFDGDGVPDTTITIEHDHVAVTHDKPQTTGTQIPNGATTAKFKGVGQSDLNKTVTRTVTITNPDGTAKTTKQTFASTRDAVVDMVDGSVVYGDWTKGQWDAVDIPAIEHYTASQTSVPEQSVDGSMSDTTVNVTYTANAETVTVQWVDDTENGKVVYSTNVSLQPGKITAVWIFGLDDTGHASTDAINLNSMYDLVGVSDSNVLKSWGKGYYNVFNLAMPSADNWIDGNTYTVHLTHKIVNTNGYASPTKVTLRTTNSERYPNLMYTDDAAWNKTHKDVTRTITIVKPDGSQSTTTQKLTFSRQAQYDMVTGEFKGYTDWKEGTRTFAAYTPSAIAGYTAETAPTATVTGDSDNSAVTLHYTTDKQTVTVQWVDDTENGKVIYSTNVSLYPGKTTSVWIFGLDDTGGASNDAVVLNTMYDLAGVSDSNVLKSWGQGYYNVFNLAMPSADSSIDGNTYTVHLTHKIVKTDGYVSPTKVALRTTNSERYPNLMYTDDAALNKTQKNVTRTITVVKPDGSQSTTTQKLTFSRQAQYDRVTGEFKGYTDWKEGTQTFAAYTPDAIDGYTAEMAPAATATGDSDNSTVTLHYTANPQTAKIVYTDTDGNTVKTDAVNGVTGQTVDTNSVVPTGWKLVDGQTIPATIKLSANTPDTKITVEHDHVMITPDNPQTDGTDIPNGTAQFKGVSENNLNQTLTRTIKINDPHAGVKTVTQMAKISRNAIVDMVDGSVVYGDWSTTQWPEYVVPTVEHYTVSQTSVPEQTVDGSTADATVNVTYTVNTETVTVQWVDDTENGKVVYSTDVSSQPGKTKLVWIFGPYNPDAVALGGMYDLADISDSDVLTLSPWGQGYYDVFNLTMPSVDKWIDGNTYTVHLTHKIVKTDGYPSPTKVSLRTTNSERYPNLMYTDDAALSKTHKDVTRTITIVKPDGSQSTTTQKLAFSRQAQYDMVTGEFKGYTDWKEGTQTFAVYTPNAIDGYTAETAPTATATGNSDNSTVTVHYTANPQTAKIVYIDTDGNTVKTDTVNGVTDQTVDTNSTVPTGWKLVDGQTIPATIKLSVNTPDTKITVEHNHVTITPDNPQVDDTDIPNGVAKFKGVSDSDLNQTITRTIQVNDPYSGGNDITQTAKISRSATVDMVDGSVVYGDWSTAQWPEYVVPTVDGYTPTQVTVEKKSVTNGDQDETVAVEYLADSQTVQINYVYNGQVVKNDSLNGYTDDVVAFTPSVPTGYKLVDPTSVPSSITITANPGDVTIAVDHDHVTIASDKPQADGTQIPNGTAKFKGVSDSDLNKTVTRTVTITSLDGTAKTTKQTFTSTRDAVVDMVDGSVVYGDWTKGQWDAVDVPTIEHYTASQTSVPAQTVDGSTADATVNVTYTVNDETVTVQWIDDETGEALYSEAVTAKPNVTKPVYAYGVDSNGKASDDMLYLQGCYELVSVSDTSVLTLYNSTMSRYFDAYNVVFPSVDNWIDGNTYSVHLKHHVVTVRGMDNPTSETFRNTNTARYPKLMFTEDAATDKTNHTVTRTIILHQPSGDKTVIQSTDFERGAYYDAVNGKFLGYTDWRGWPTTLSSYEVPTVAGYTVSIQEVPSLKINGDSVDQTVEVNYTANAQTTHVVYVDQNGNQIQSDDVDGHTDETVKVTSKMPAGWALADGQSVPESITFGVSTPDVKVVVKHGHVVVTPDAPKTSNDKLPDNPAQNYPTGVGDDNLNKTVTRTINVHNLDGTVTPIVQTAHLTRTADVDEVDGTVTYGEWTTGSWDKFVSTPIDGYTASLTEMPATEVSSATADTSFDVIYTANSQSMRINYIDENGQTVGSTIVNGHTDETVTTNSKVPVGWKLIDGQSVPAEITFKGAKTADVKVKVEHAHVTVTPDAPKTSTDKLPDNADKNYPSGVGHDNLNKTITRTIEIDEPNGNIIFVPKQEVHYTRTADVDEVNGTVTYGEWTTKDQFAEFANIPVFAGYTPSQDKIDATVPSVDDNNSAVKITYTANEQSMQIVYVGENGQTVKADTVKGHTDETVPTNSTVPAGWTTENAVPAEITFKGAKTADVTIKVKHAHVTVTPDKPKTANDKLPNNTDKNYPSGVDHDDLNKTVKRTINVYNVDGTTATVEQEVHFTRTADVDEVDGTVEYGSWQADKQFDQYAVPVVPGYVSVIDGKEQSTIQPAMPNVDDNGSTIDVTYQAVDGSQTIDYVDENDTVIGYQIITGKTAETKPVKSAVPVGWKLADGQTVPATVTIKADDVPIKVLVEHGHVAVSHDNAQKDGTRIPNGVSVFNGVTDDDLNQTLTRTITVNDPHAGAKAITQTAKIYRDAVVDMVDGSVVYGKWSTAEWPAFTVPTVDGYTPSQTTVEAKTVANGDQDDAVTINYTADKQTAKIVYTDADNNPVKTDTVDGVTDQTVDTNSTVPMGWKLVDGQTIPAMIKLGVNTPDTIVKVEHDHVSVNHDNPQTDGTDIPNGAAQFKGVSDNDLNQTLTRTITINDPHNGAKAITQTAKISRDATVDMVDGSVVYGDWSTAEWPAYSVPTVDGYTPSQKTVEAKTVIDGTKDDNATIDYTANAQTAKIVYTDADGNPVKTDTIDGVTDQTVDTNSTVPTGWKLINGQTIPATIKLGVNTPDTIVKVEHGHVSVSHDNPQTDGMQIPNGAAQFKGVSDNDLNQTLTRTIMVNDPHAGAKTIAQTAKISRDATVDMVDGSVAYGNWSTAEWSEYSVPTVDGYTPSQTMVEKKSVTNGDHNDNVTIDYKANAQTAKIVYTDENDQPVKTDTVDGVTDQTVDTNSTVPTGWKLADGQTIPTTIKLGANTPDTVVKVEHDHVSVNHDNPQTDGTDIPNGTAQFKGVSDSDLNQTLTRTITVNDPHAGVKTITQTAQIYRDATVDMVDGSVVYSDWSTAQWPAYFVPTVDGYTPSQATVEAKTVIDGTKDDNVTIDYTADKQTTNVVYVDENGNQIKSDAVNGVTDQTVKVVSNVPAGWKLVDGQSVPTEITFKGAKTADVEVKVEHAHVTVTPDAPKTSTDKLPDNADKSYPNGVDHNDLNKTVKRTINVHNVDGTTTTVEQEVHFTRTADVDEADGTVVYGNWQADKQFDQYAVPAIPGYVSMIDGKKQSTIQPAMPNVDDNDSTIEVSYQAVDGSQTIDYVDENGTVISYQIITGKTAETKPVNSAVPTGWKLVDGQAVPDTVTIKADDVPVKVSIEHDHVAVSHDNPQNDGIKIPNGVSVFNGVTDDDLNQTLTRTITVNDPHTGVKTVAQTAKISRDATVDMVDGSVVYGDWSTAEWPEYSVPAVDGYTSSQTAVEAKTVANGDQDDAVTIDYTANKQTAKIVYVDENDNPVKTDTVDGVTDQIVDANSTVPTGWKLVDGQTIPATIKLGVNTPDTIVKVEHDHVSISHDNPQADGADIPGGTTKFSGVTDDDLNQTLTRTITINDPHAGVKTVTQTVKISRDATVDMVDGSVVYGDWSTAQWPEYVVPTVDGYTPSQKTVEAKAVVNGDKDDAVAIDYTADKQTAKIVYTDENGNPVKTDTVEGVTDQTVDANSTVPTGWKLVDGQTVPATIKLGVNTPDTIVKVEHDHVSVSHDNPQTDGTDIPGGAVKFSGVADNDLNQTLIRTITVNDPHTGVKTVTQTAKISRDAVVDMVDGSVAYGDWSTAEWPEYSAPTVDGYTPSQKTIEAKTVVDGDQNAVATIDYTADKQTAKIVYMDENDQPVKTDTVEGVTDQTVDANSTVPTGWKLVDGQTIPVTIKLGVNTPDAIVKVEHDHVSISHNNPQTDGADIPGGIAKFSGVADNNLNQTLTRTITVNDPHTGVKTVTQTAKISRDATVDMVDGSVVYGGWSTAEWPEYSVPTVDGYTPSQTTVEAKTVANGDQDDVVTIDYTADKQMAKIVYTDENGNPVKTDTVEGVTDQTVDANSTVPTGWKLVDGQTIPVTIKLGVNTPDTVVKVEHDHVSISHNNPQTDGANIPNGAAQFKGVSDSDLNQTLTRTITVNDPHEGVKTITQTAKISRDATVDMVDGSVVYGDWSTAQWPEYVVPTVDGYTPSQKTVEVKAVVNGDKDDAVAIDYTADKQTAKIVYTDENGNPVKTDTVEGVTDQTVDANSTVPTGWKLVDGQTVPATIKLGVNMPDTIVKVEHDHVSVSHDNPQIDGTDIPNGVAKFKGVSDSDLNQTLTRTITINDPHAGTKTITQTAKISRNATVDMVDGSVVYGEWSTAEWPEYSAPTVDGYTPSQATVEAKTIADGDEDDTVTIDYTANAQTAKIVYTDADDNPVKTDTADGVTDQIVDVNSTVPTGWKLVDGQTIPATIKLGANTSDTIVKVEHDHVSVSHSNPQTDGTDIPNGAAQFKGVSDSDLNQTLTRTITVNDPHAGVKTITQTAKISRNATVDMVDGSVAYSDWSTAEWPEYSVPTVDGYTPSQKIVEAKTVADSDQDDAVMIDYTADKQTAKIVYTDENDNPVKTDTVDGVTDQTVDANSTVPTGWKLVDGQMIPTTIKLGVNTPDTIVKVEHDHVSVSHNNPQTDGTDIPGGTAKFNGVADNDLNQTLTRTITINDPHQGAKTIAQTAKISRDATVDMVDGSVAYGDWSTAEWPAYSVPTVDGYTPSQATVEAKTVTNGDQDDVATINYTADKQTAKIVYVDENGNPVKTDTVDGVTDQTVDANSTVPAGWKLIDGQMIPVTIKLGANTPDAIVKVEHDHVSISHDNPQIDGTDIPSGAAKFSGVADNDLNQTLTRTITINDPHDGVKTITQTAQIHRDATVDMVDGSVVYGDWSTTEWPAYFVPTVDGYTPSQATIEKKSVTNGDQDDAVTIDYKANAQTAKIVYTDENDQPVKTDTVDGVTNQTVDTNSTVPTGWKLVDGQTVPATIKLGANTPATIVKVEHDHVTITSNKPQTDGTDIPGGTAKFSGVDNNDLNQTLTRTITINDPHEGVKTITQTAKISRDATVDMVDGSVKYGDWSTAEWPEYSVPTVDGYTPNQKTVEAKAVVNGDQDGVATINYTADKQTAKIVYTDENGNPVKADTVDGVTDQTVDTNSTVPTGWKLADGQTIPTTIKLGVATPDTIVKVEHDHVTITSNKPQTDGTNIPGGTAKFSGVDNNDLNQTLTRTITINDPHEGVKMITQTARIHRDATVDMVDGSVVYGDWSTAEWPEYFVPAVDGYTPSQTTIEAKTVVDGDQDDVATINYTADKQTAKIVYADENGNPVKTDTVEGVTDQIVDANITVPTGWKSVDGQTIPVTIKLGVNTPDAVVKVEHDHVMITSNNPQADGTDIPGGTTKFSGVADDDLNQTLIRTIIVKLPNGQTKALAQTVKISRDATVDMVDGSVVYGDWSTAEWSEYSVPTVDGYTPSQKIIEAKAVADGSQNETVTVDYTADDGTQTINYVDENGNPVVKQTLHGNVVVKQIIHGKTDQEIAVNHDKLFGWVLEDGQTVPTTVKIKAVDEPITIKLKHGIVTVTPDAPKTEFDRMPDWTDKDYPAGVGYNDLNKTVTRTITFELPDGQTKTVKQTTTFTRYATVDEVTNAVTYSDWNEQSHTFDAIDVPGVDGWTSSAEQIADITVTPDSKDEQVTVAYTANPKTPAEKVNQTDEVKSSESAPTAGVKETPTGTVANKTVEAENNVKADSHAKTAELPQTGNEQTGLQATAGLALTGLAVMLGLGRKKRKND